MRLGISLRSKATISRPSNNFAICFRLGCEVSWFTNESWELTLQIAELWPQIINQCLLTVHLLVGYGGTLAWIATGHIVCRLYFTLYNYKYHTISFKPVLLTAHSFTFFLQKSQNSTTYDYALCMFNYKCKFLLFLIIIHIVKLKNERF